MGAGTKIDWCDATWNPVTGCLHGCEYCYARRIAERFGTQHEINEAFNNGRTTSDIFISDEDYEKCNVFLPPDSVISVGTLSGVKPSPCVIGRRVWVNGKPSPYPFGFVPTFHRYRLDEPQKWKKPKNIFVCSMADLFGDWVPDEWICEVFKACSEAPQHRYLFLTKNPKRYETFEEKRIRVPDNAWLGYSIDYEKDEQWFDLNDFIAGNHTFVSVEPILHRLNQIELRSVALTEWCIVGAETGMRKGKVIPQRDWVTEIADKCRALGVPIFMKESLRDLMGNDFRQEFPWEIKRVRTLL